MANTAAAVKKKSEPEAKTYVLISRKNGPMHVPYGTDPDAPGGKLGIAPGEKSDAGGVSKLHTIYPGINPPIAQDMMDHCRAHPGFNVWEKARDVFELTKTVYTIDDDACEPMLERSSSIDGIKWWLSQETRKPWKKKLRAVILEMEDFARKTGGNEGDDEDED